MKPKNLKMLSRPTKYDTSKYKELSDEEKCELFQKEIYKMLKTFEMDLREMGYDESHAHKFVAGQLAISCDRYMNWLW